MPFSPPTGRRRLLLAVLGLGLLALVVHTLFGERGYLALRREQQKLHSLESEIKRLEEENRRLAEEIKALKSDPQAVERVAREQLQMARPGEKIILLPEQEPTPDEPGKSQEQ